MPGSLLGLGSLIRRNDSTRSDRSDFSGHSNDSRTSKKVSFNKAVRVKKYPLLSEDYNENDLDEGPMTPTTSRRYWFKVYQNNSDSNQPQLNGNDKQIQEENEGKLTPIAEDSDLGSDLHSSQLPAQAPSVNKNHVKNIVTKFNKELTKLRKKWEEKPEETPANGLENPILIRNLNVLSKTNPKPSNTFTKRDESTLSSRQREVNNHQLKNANNVRKSTTQGISNRSVHMNGLKTNDNSTLSKGRQVEQQSDKRKVTTVRIGINDRNTTRPCSRYTATKTENKQPENYRRVAGRQTVNFAKSHETPKLSSAQNERTPMNQRAQKQSSAYECKRRSKSHDEMLKSPPRSCLRNMDKSISTDELSKRTPVRYTTKSSPRNGNDKGVQCNGTISGPLKESSSHLPKSSQLVLQVNGAARANNDFLNHSMRSPFHSSLLAASSKSEIKDPFSSLPANYQTNYEDKERKNTGKKERDPVVSVIANHILDYHSKCQKDRFSDESSASLPSGTGLKANLQVDHFNDRAQSPKYKEERDFCPITRNNNYASFRSQNNCSPNKFLYINEIDNDMKENTPSSVMREVDFRKREISYENVPREGRDDNHKWNSQENANQKSPLLKRKNFSSKEHAFTLPIPGRKSEKNRGKKSNRSKSIGKDDDADDKLSQCYDDGDYTSFQDDALYCRRSASVPRQPPSETKSTSSATTMLLRRYRDSSIEGRKDYSPMSCSDSEAVVRKRKTLVMYIPGVSHHNRPAEDDDRMSSISTAWSQASEHQRIHRGKDKEYGDMSIPVHQSQSDQYSDIYRRHSMPKDTRLQWLKWKAKGKLSREP